MNKPTDNRRTGDNINYPNRLRAIPTASDLKANSLNNEFSSIEPDLDELQAPLNRYDKILKFCCSWNFVFIFLAVLSAFIIYRILHYWFL